MDIKGSKLLLIGGAGLIGSHTVDALIEEDVAEILIYDNFTRGSRENLSDALRDSRVSIFPIGGDIMQSDILMEAMRGIDGVFLFAALWLQHCQDFPRAAFNVNVHGTFNVIEACVHSDVKRLVYSSSASVYGDAVQEPMTEDHPFNNLTFYGATKIAGEQMCRAMYHRYKGTAQKFDYTGLRYMNVYGPRQDYRGTYVSVIMKILDRIDRGLPPVIFGDGSQSYDFIYVGDCAAANVCAMKADTTDSFYNVGAGIKVSIRELTQKILEITGSNLEIEYNADGLTYVTNRVGCPEKAEVEIGFKAGMELETGLRRLIEWRKEHKDAVARRRKDAGIPDD